MGCKMKSFIKKISIVLLMLALAMSLSAKAKKTVTKKVKKNVKVTEQTVQYPKSIVTLSPSAAEILYAIGAGDQIVAVSEFTDYPPEAAAKPVVGGFDGKTLSIETIISFEPDFVYLTEGMHNFLIEPLDSYGIKWYLSNATSITAIEKEIMDLGEITGHQDEAAQVVAQMAEKLPKTSGDSSIKVYYEVWNAPFMSVGSTSFINDVIVNAGGKNIFENEEYAYPMVSEEAVLDADPEFIFYTGDGMGGGKPSDIFKPKGGIYYMGDDDRYVRSVPRCVDAVEKLSNILWK